MFEVVVQDDFMKMMLASYDSTLADFKVQITMESKRALDNVIQEKLKDQFFVDFLKEKELKLTYEQVQLEHLQQFIVWVSEKKVKDWLLRLKIIK